MSTRQVYQQFITNKLKELRNEIPNLENIEYMRLATNEWEIFNGENNDKCKIPLNKEETIYKVVKNYQENRGLSLREALKEIGITSSTFDRILDNVIKK